MPTPDKSTTSPSLKGASRGWILAALLLLVVLALGNIRLLSGSAAPQWDAVDFFGPQFALVGDQIRAGHLLKWDPWVGAGGPDWAEPELGTTSPILLAASFLSINPQEGYVAYWVAVWAFGGIGMLLLTRHLRCPAWGGAIAALGFVASGFYTGHAEHMSSIYSVSFLPWILWRLDAGLQNRDWWCGVQAGALYGLSALGGYPAFTILTPGFLFLWALGRVLCRDSGSTNENHRSTPVFAAIVLILTIGVGFVIFSPPYTGILVSTHGYSDHMGARPRQVSISSNLLPAGAFATFASPYLALLNFPPKAMWPETDVSMTSIYTGGASLILALFGWQRRSGWRWWLVLMVAFFACCALGSQLPLRGWLYDFVPPTRYFRNPALFRGYVIFIIGILAALGARDLADAPAAKADRLRLWLISMFLACSSVITFSLVVWIAPSLMPELPAGIAHLIVVWFGLAALTYLVKREYLSVPAFVQCLVTLAVLDATGALYLSRPTLYTAATLPWWHQMNARHNSDLDLHAAGLMRDLHSPEALGSYPNNRNLLLKTAVFDSYMTLWNRFQQKMLAHPGLSGMATGSDRFWFSPVVARRPPDDATFNVFRKGVPNFDRQSPILVVHSPEQMRALSPAGPPDSESEELGLPLDVPVGIPAPVSDVSYKLDSLAFQYSAPMHGYLLVTDRWAEGWEVTVNGRQRPVMGGNFIFRAVEVEAGANRIHFQYNPRGFWPLVFASWGSLLLFAVVQCHRLLPMARERLPAGIRRANSGTALLLHPGRSLRRGRVAFSRITERLGFPPPSERVWQTLAPLAAFLTFAKRLWARMREMSQTMSEAVNFGPPARPVKKYGWYAVPLVAFLIAEAVNRLILKQQMVIYYPYYQFLDPSALKTDLFRGMMLLHGQPPLLNLALGLILKTAAAIGCKPEALADLLFGLLGLSTALLLFHLTVRWTSSHILACAAVVLYFAEPSYFGGSNSGVGRNNFFYEFALQGILLLICASAACWLETKDYRPGFIFVLATAAVVNTRTLFHPIVWGVVVVMAVLLPNLLRHTKKTVVLVACAVCLLGAWPVKNYLLFGILTSSSWDGFNLCRGLAPLPPTLLQINMNDKFPDATGLLSGFPRIAQWPRTSLQVVMSGSKSCGGPNWNSLYMVTERNGAVANGLAARKNLRAYWTHMVLMYKYVTRAMYVQPYSDEAFQKYPDQFSGYLWFYDRLFYSSLSDRMAGRNTRHWNVFGVFIVPGLLFGALAHIVFSRRTRVLMAVIAYTALFPIISACLSDGIEGNRMRHSTYPLMILLSMLLISEAYRRSVFWLRRNGRMSFPVAQSAAVAVASGNIEVRSFADKDAGDHAHKRPGEPSIDWLVPPRVWAFLAVLTAFVGLSFNRFSEFAWSEHRLDLVSQADNIGMPARRYLNSRLAHAAPVGCLSANPAWPDACDYLWYSMLPYYTKPTPPGMEPAYRYVIFVGDPLAPERLELQASRVRNYRIEAPLTPEAVLLVRRNP